MSIVVTNHYSKVLGNKAFLWHSSQLSDEIILSKPNITKHVLYSVGCKGSIYAMSGWYVSSPLNATFTSLELFFIVLKVVATVSLGTI